MSHKAYILLADGFEEVEAFTPADYLHRAGIEIMLIAIGEARDIAGAHGVRVFADMMAKFTPYEADWDCLILPGGMPGASNLANNLEANSLLRKAQRNSALICAICASPALVLAPAGILTGHAWTCYPGMEREVGGRVRATWKDERVVVDGNVITSRSAGTAGEWSLKIIEKMLGADAAAKVAKAVLLDY